MAVNAQVIGQRYITSIEKKDPEAMRSTELPREKGNVRIERLKDAGAVKYP